jgi:quercetin dioxygenase-like cupin family protein
MEENKNFSLKMKKLRVRKRISLEDLATKTGYSEEYLSQIENNEVLAPVSVILSVSQALSIASEDFLATKEEKRTRRRELKQRRESFEKRAENYSYEVLTPQGKHKHLNAFKVTIQPQQDLAMVEYHHLGEEFIYVLSGTLELKVGRLTYKLEAEESIHFDSSKAHRLRSLSKEPTVILVSIYSP